MCKNIQNVYKFHVYRLTAELLQQAATVHTSELCVRRAVRDYTLHTKSNRSAWQVKSMERRNKVSFFTTEMQHSWDRVKGRGSISGASLAVVDSESRVERGHSAVLRRRIRSLKCWDEK